METIVGVVVGVLTILGIVFGWFRAAWAWFSSKYLKEHSALIEVPAKTIIVLPEPRSNAFWWHMGSEGGNPAMQIVGDVKITNISVYGVRIIAAKLKKPALLGHALVKDVNTGYAGDYPIPQRSTVDCRFDFWVIPPVIEKGGSFKADVAFIDQFGNEHWLKNIEFKYA